MPAAPRPDNKCKKIAYKILGVPQNFIDKQDEQKKRINQKLNYEDTRLVR